MILFLVRNIPFLRNYYFNKAGRKYVGRKLRHIFSHLHAGEKILDIGSGNGLIAYMLREKGYDVTLIDIHEGQYHPSVKPQLYDGKKMPFTDQSFDTGILLTILHHTKNQEEILREATRVCNKLIVIEDIYKNSFQKYYTFAIDRFVNLFYSPCPHTNRTHEGWQQLFSSLGLQIEAVYTNRILGVKQVLYVLGRVGRDELNQ